MENKIFAILLVFFLILKVWFISEITDGNRSSEANLQNEIANILSGNGFTYPPLLPFIMAVSPLSYPQLKILMPILFNLLTLYFLMKLFERYEHGNLLAILTMFIPMIFLHTSYILTDTIFLPLALGSIYYYRNNNMAAFGVTYILTILTKPLLPLLLLPIFFTSTRFRDMFILSLILALAALSLYLSLNFTDWFVISNYTSGVWYFNYKELLNTLVFSGLVLLLPAILEVKLNSIEKVWLLAYFPFILFGALSMSRYFLVSNIMLLPILQRAYNSYFKLMMVLYFISSISAIYYIGALI